MLQIVVLEDDFAQQDRIEEALKAVISERELTESKVVVYDKPNQLLEEVTDRGAQVIYFLETQIKGSGQEGFEMAEIIRYRDPYATIAFVTMHTECLPITFQYKVAAVDFIDKRLDEAIYRQRLSRVIELALRKVGQPISDYSFKIETAKTALQIPYHDILFFETSDIVHKVILHTKDEQISFYGQLSKIAQSDDRLFKCHKSFVVNPKNVVKIDKEEGKLSFANGDYCYISKKKIKTLIERMGMV